MYYNNPNDFWMPDMSGLTEEEQKEASAKILRCGCGMYVVMAIVLFILMLFSSCGTTKYVPVLEQRTDTLIQTKLMRDSIYQKDSIHIRESGDTVYFTRWRTRLVTKERLDTVYISKCDSVPVPYPVEKIVKVEKQLPWWKRTLMWLGVALIGIVAVWIWRTK